MSRSTVKTHRIHGFAKRGASTRADAAAPTRATESDSALVQRARVGGPAGDGPAQRSRRRRVDRGHPAPAPACGRRCGSRPVGRACGSWSRSPRATERTSSSVSEFAVRAGSTPARNSTSSTSRLPSPAIRDWSMSTAFTGARLPASRSRRNGRRTVAASGPSRSSSGSSSTAPSRRGSRRKSVPPSVKRSPNRRHAGLSAFAA